MSYDSEGQFKEVLIQYSDEPFPTAEHLPPTLDSKPSRMGSETRGFGQRIPSHNTRGDNPIPSISPHFHGSPTSMRAPSNRFDGLRGTDFPTQEIKPPAIDVMDNNRWNDVQTL